jgi:hypothetical protein
MFLLSASSSEIATGAGRLRKETGRTGARRLIMRSIIAFAPVLGTPMLVPAQAVQDWSGKRVVPKSREFTLRHEDPFAARSDFAFTIYRVVNADGRALWLQTEVEMPETRWVQSDQVVLVDDAVSFLEE